MCVCDVWAGVYTTKCAGGMYVAHTPTFRGSVVDPTILWLDRLLLVHGLIAPTANTESASAGAPMVLQSGSAPSFPAEFTTKIPFEAAKLPVRDTRELMPSMSFLK